MHVLHQILADQIVGSMSCIYLKDSILFGSWKIIIFMTFNIACVASVPVRAERNIGPREGVFTFGTRGKWGESKKDEGRGGGGERRERLPANPSILKNAHRLSWLISLND